MNRVLRRVLCTSEQAGLVLNYCSKLIRCATMKSEWLLIFDCQVYILLFLRQPVGYNEVGYLSFPCSLDLFSMEGSSDMKSC